MNIQLTNFEPRTIALLMVSTAILVAAALGHYIIWPEIQSYNKSHIKFTSLESGASQQSSLSMQIEKLESKLTALQKKLHGDMIDLPDNQMESFVIGQLHEDITEDCPRCGEHIDACECAEKDPWSTQVYHRAPKGTEIKPKPKQEFKK